MSLYEPGEVYNNIVRMLDYRAVRMTSELLSQDALVQQLNHHKHTIITGVRGAEDPRGAAEMTVVLLSPASLAANKSAEFKKVAKVIKTSNTAPGNVMFVSAQAFNTHAIKALVQMRADFPAWTIEHHDYMMFLIEHPKHACVSPHVVMTNQEVQELCARYRFHHSAWPKILASDTMAVWIGLKPGMCVKIMRTSETAGCAVSYRVCIKG